ncbi:cyclic nucleotide-binding domain-containing protein [Methylobacterium sp. P31]
MQSLDTLSPPFDRLTHDQAETLKQHIDVGYFRPGVAIVRQGQASDCLHVIIKGAVEARHGAALHDVLGTGDIFDARAVVHNEASEDFIAAEETLCFLIPRNDILDLVRRNDGFAAFFYAEALAQARCAFRTARSQRDGFGAWHPHPRCALP